MTAPDGPAGAVDARERLLDDVAADGLDVAGARSRVAALHGARRRSRRTAVGLGGAFGVLLLGAWFLLGGEDPDELVADRVAPVTTSTTTSTTTLLATTSTTPMPDAAPPPPVVTVTTATTAPPTTASPPTSLANQPMRAELRVLTPVVGAGDVAAVEVAWIDADHTGGPPVFEQSWGDPAVGSAATAPAAATCNAPGVSDGGAARLEFRYATPGSRQVRVTVVSCAGGAYAERLTLDAVITVTEARTDDTPATAVVAVAPRGAGGASVPPLDDALAEFLPRGTPTAPIALPARTPALAQVGATGPASVLRLPVGAVGTVRLTWKDSSCSSSSEVDLSVPAATTPVLTLTSSC